MILSSLAESATTTPTSTAAATTSAWRPIPGYPDCEISDSGKVRYGGRSFPHHGTAVLIGKNPAFRLAGTGEFRLVCHLVLEAFKGACPEGGEATHLNDDPTDNRLANLAWLSGDEVRELALRMGRPLRAAPAQELSVAVVRYLRKRYAEGNVTTARLAWECGLPQATVCSLVARPDREAERQRERERPNRRGDLTAVLGLPPRVKRRSRPRRK